LSHMYCVAFTCAAASSACSSALKSASAWWCLSFLYIIGCWWPTSIGDWNSLWGK
jgi:hypothetical protein